MNAKGRNLVSMTIRRSAAVDALKPMIFALFEEIRSGNIEPTRDNAELVAITAAIVAVEVSSRSRADKPTKRKRKR